MLRTIYLRIRVIEYDSLPNSICFDFFFLIPKKTPTNPKSFKKKEESLFVGLGI